MILWPPTQRCRDFIQLGLVQHEDLMRRLHDVPCSDEDHRLIEARIKGLCA